MLKLELKRILKTRFTWWLTVIALAICVFYIYAATHSGLLHQYVDENGEWTHALSLDGYRMKKESLEHLTGEITPEFISRAVESYQELLARYGSTLNAPNKEVEEVVSRYGPVWDWVYWYFTDPETGAPLLPEEINPEKAMDFYSERLHSLEMMVSGIYRQGCAAGGGLCHGPGGQRERKLLLQLRNWLHERRRQLGRTRRGPSPHLCCYPGICLLGRLSERCGRHPPLYQKGPPVVGADKEF